MSFNIYINDFVKRIININKLDSFQKFKNWIDNNKSIYESVGHDRDELINYSKSFFNNNKTVIGEKDDASVGGEHLFKKFNSNNFDLFLRYIADKKENGGKGIPKVSVDSLRTSIEEIVEYFGDPQSNKMFKKIGMVIGQVQSGKTLHMTGVIHKAIDLGYKNIIILTSNTNELRDQTSERISHDVIGNFSQNGYPSESGIRKYLNENTIHESLLNVAMCTGAKSDSIRNSSSISGNVYSLLFVFKKNRGVLSDWINNFPESKSSDPTLIIDDEADWGSVNTKDDSDDIANMTAINNEIRKMINNVFPMVTYVSYTATPYANLFARANLDKNNDIYPKDFITYIKPGWNYKGYEYFFQNNENNQLLINIDSNVNYKDDDTFFESDYFRTKVIEVLTCFISQIFFEEINDTNEKLTFLVNVSRLTRLHTKILREIQNIHSTLKTNAMQNADLSWLKKYVIENYHYHPDDLDEQLITFFNKYYGEGGLNFAIWNSKSDDKRSKDRFHNVIIGGNILSRGITISNITTIWFIRNVQTTDTLLQMARWFGYHKITNHRKIRLFTTDELYEKYIDAAELSNELHEDILHHAQENDSPETFIPHILRKRIKPTAANKMRNASVEYITKSFSNNFVSELEVSTEIYNQRKTTIEAIFRENKPIKLEDFLIENIDLNIVFKLIDDSTIPHKENIKNEIKNHNMKVNIVISANKSPGKLLNDEALPFQDAFNGVDLNFRIREQMKHHNKIKSLHVKSDANIDNDYKRNYTSQKDKRTLEDGVLFIAIPFVGGKNGEFGKYIGYSIKFPGYTPFAEDTPTYVNETI